jgi:SSS family solute:Na+ symporter
MVVGFAMGLFRMLVDTPVTLGIKPNGYDPGSFLWIINNINFQYFSILITAVSAIVMVAVSYATPAPDYLKLKDLTFATRTESYRSASQGSWGWKEVAASVVVLAVVAFGYLYFRGLARRAWRAVASELSGSWR